MSNLIKSDTCFKKREKPTGIDLFLTNKPEMFLKFAVFVKGLSNFPKMTL